MAVAILAIIKSNLKTKDIDIAIISADIYYAAFDLKKVQVFAISMRNIQY